MGSEILKTLCTGGGYHALTHFFYLIQQSTGPFYILRWGKQKLYLSPSPTMNYLQYSGVSNQNDIGLVKVSEIKFENLPTWWGQGRDKQS